MTTSTLESTAERRLAAVEARYRARLRRALDAVGAPLDEFAVAALAEALLADAFALAVAWVEGERPRPGAAAADAHELAALNDRTSLLTHHLPDPPCHATC